MCRHRRALILDIQTVDLGATALLNAVLVVKSARRCKHLALKLFVLADDGDLDTVDLADASAGKVAVVGTHRALLLLLLQVLLLAAMMGGSLIVLIEVLHLADVASAAARLMFWNQRSAVVAETAVEHLVVRPVLDNWALRRRER